MGTRPKNKMPPEKRAKQFMPFSPLSGLNLALAAKEHIVVPRSELSEDRAEEIDRILHMIKVGDMVSTVYFCRGEYLRIMGMVAKLDAENRILRIVSTEIPFDDLYELEIRG